MDEILKSEHWYAPWPPMPSATESREKEFSPSLHYCEAHKCSEMADEAPKEPPRVPPEYLAQGEEVRTKVKCITRQPVLVTPGKNKRKTND